jgi:uncharacterized membrane protein YdcZ (DUF606 family)
MINKHLMPSFVSFIIGFFLLAVVPVRFMTRTGKVIFSPFDYSRGERRLFFLGIFLGVAGLCSSILISELYGYYYFHNGTPTFLKGEWFNGGR